MSGQGRNGSPPGCEPDAVTAGSNQANGVTMPDSTKSTGRVTAVLALLVLATVALHGYLPGTQRPIHGQPPHNPAAQIVVIAMLGMSLGIVAIAVIARVKGPRVVSASSASADATSNRRRDGWGRPTRRALLIRLGVIVAGLLILVLLALIFLLLVPHVPQHGFGHAPPATGPSTAPPATSTGPPPRQPGDSGGNVLGYVIGASTVIFLLMLAAGTLVLRSRKRRVGHTDVIVDDHSESASAAAGSEEPLARAAERGLAEIGDASREPRTAIIACYVAMEHALANSPGTVPQDFDTPSEVLSRAVEQHALHTDSATQLVELFTEARFSAHVMNEGHRDVALQVLQRVLAELRSAA